MTAAALVGWTGIAGAQALTDAEIKARFQEQIDTFRAVRENPELGASRGLVLTNVAPAAEADTGATIAAPGGLTLPAKSDAAGATAGADATEPVLAHWSMPEDRQVNLQVRFAFDSAALEESERAKLRQVCGVLDEMDIAKLRVVGHTDASGAAGYNQQLSVLRAEEVARFFVGECGIEAGRLEAIGVGEQFPFDAADPFAGENRRVEFQAMS